LRRRKDGPGVQPYDCASWRLYGDAINSRSDRTGRTRSHRHGRPPVADGVTWFWAYEASRYQVPPPSPHGMRDRILQAIVFGAWTIGVPALATGMWAMSAPLVSVGAWALFVGVALATLDSVLVVAPALRAGVARSRPAA
jgi:hypothetical protein